MSFYVFTIAQALSDIWKKLVRFKTNSLETFALCAYPSIDRMFANTFMLNFNSFCSHLARERLRAGDEESAIHCYRCAANAGDCMAQLELADMFATFFVACACHGMVHTHLNRYTARRDLCSPEDLLDAVHFYKASGSQYWFRWMDCVRGLSELDQVSIARDLCNLHIGTIKRAVVSMTI
jgi:hypothetical protein